MSNPNEIPAIPAPVIPPPAVALPVVNVQSLTPSSASAHVPLPTSSSVPVAPTPALPGAPVAQVHYEVPAHPIPVPPKKKNIIARYWAMIGAGSLAVSLLIHAGLIALAILIVTVTVHEPKVDFLPGGGSKGAAEASQQMAHQVQNKKRTNLNKSTPMRRVVSNSTTASSISLPDVPMDSIDVPEMSSLMGGAMGSGGFGSAGSGGGFGKGQGIGGQGGFISPPPSMKSRCSSAERLQKLRESGGSPECEKAVSNALEFLKTKQNKDGSWGTGHKCGMTGMALLCFLGRCETPDSPFYGDNVMKGVLYLLEVAKKNPDGIFSEKPEAIGGAYEHGIATYAMGELYTLARLGSKSLPGMREAFEKGVKKIIDMQNDSGSWDYYTKNGAPSKRDDISVTGWQYQALKAAKHTSLPITGLHTSIDKAVKYLEKTQTPDGGFGAVSREAHYNQYNMSGAAILGMQTLGHGKSVPIKKGVKFLDDFTTKEPPDWTKNANLYAWYYYAQVFFQAGGSEWKKWNDVALPQILANQRPDGGWKDEKFDFAASSTTSAGADRDIYRTALCTLMLEVYYRYLKVGDREQGSIFDKK